MAGALERSRENQYHLYNVDGLGDDITLVAKVRLTHGRREQLRCLCVYMCGLPWIWI